MIKGNMKRHREYWESVRDYDKEVFSVYKALRSNPVKAALKNRPKKYKVAYLGVGSGFMLPFLSRKFSKVYAVDFSKTLLDRCKSEFVKFENIEYINADFRDLRKIKEKVDIVISVNSILPPSIKDKMKILKQISKMTKRNGLFIGILPSADVVIYRVMLEIDNLIRKGYSEKRALKKWEEFLDRKSFSPLGFHTDDYDSITQKYWYPFEIRFRLKDAGFKSIKIGKAYYKWSYCKDNCYGYFPGKEGSWDWFVTARKK